MSGTSRPAVRRIERLIEEGDLTAAQAQAETWLGREASHLEGLRLLTLIHLSARRPALALTYADRAVRLAPGSARFKALHGTCLLLAGRAEAAVAAYEAALALQPAMAEARAGLVKALRAAGNPGVADAEAAKPLAESVPAKLSPVVARTGTARRGRRVPALVAVKAAMPSRRRTRPRPGIVDVIVPVYRGHDATIACLRAVIASSNRTPIEIVVIDDASPEPRLRRALGRLAREGGITLLRHPTNQGFVRSANEGLALHPTRDAVLLNADTLVQGDWVDRLRRAAYSSPDTASATPLSNNATICSYPVPSVVNAIDFARDPAVLDGLARTANRGQVVEIPTGVGFCLYLRRDCLDEIGLLDAETFGRGYGEENDLCLRAAKCGWRHVAAVDTFVAHHGEVSFGAEKQRLIVDNLDRLEQLHPGYRAEIAAFEAADPLFAARRHIDRARLQANGQPSILMVTHRLGGGVARHVGDLTEALAQEGIVALTLRGREGKAAKGEVEIASATQALPTPNLVYRLPEESDRLVADLRVFGVTHCHFHHFLGVPAAVFDLPRRLGTGYDATVHDYAWVCPRITLTDDSGRYCGEPAVSECERCVRRNGRLIDERLSVAGLRARSRRWLEGARQVFAPSADVATRIRRYAPAAAIVERPHPEPETSLTVGRLGWRRRGVLRVALIGAIGEPKGYRVLLDCARDAKKRDLPITFRVVGHTCDDPPLFATGRVFVTGPFVEAEALGLLAAQDCDLAFFPSLWPETWCYALSTALRAGLLPVAFDIGAIAERIRNAGVGVLLPLGLEPAAINRALLHLHAQQGRDLCKTLRLRYGSYASIAKDYYQLHELSPPHAAGLSGGHRKSQDRRGVMAR